MSSTASEFKKAFIATTRALRDRSKMTQAEMADRLGIQLETYKKYEQRTMLPHQFLEPFARAVGKTVGYMVTTRIDAPPAPRGAPPRQLMAPPPGDGTEQDRLIEMAESTMKWLHAGDYGLAAHAFRSLARMCDQAERGAPVNPQLDIDPDREAVDRTDH